jgi:stress response protein YsnF
MHNLHIYIYIEMSTEYNNNNNSSSQNNSSSWPSSMSFTSTTLHTIPVVEEKPSISKESVASNMVIEKRWVTKTELMRVPVTYEEIYVNGKPMSSGGGILSDLKKAFSGKNDTVKKSNDMKPSGEFVPVSTAEAEKVIPVFGEKIIITKKMVKLNDLVIRKRRIVENKKIKVSVTKESVKIKHPNGKIDDLST